MNKDTLICCIESLFMSNVNIVSIKFFSNFSPLQVILSKADDLQLKQIHLNMKLYYWLTCWLFPAQQHLRSNIVFFSFLIQLSWSLKFLKILCSRFSLISTRFFFIMSRFNYIYEMLPLFQTHYNQSESKGNEEKLFNFSLDTILYSSIT